MEEQICFFQAEDGIRDPLVTGVQTCALPISAPPGTRLAGRPTALPQALAGMIQAWCGVDVCRPRHRLCVPVNGVRGEGGHADRDVLGAVGSRAAVAHPFPGSRVNSLACLHGHLVPFGLHDEGTAQHDRELVELRALPGLGPARRAAQVRDAQAVLARVSPPDVLVDELGRLASRGDPARLRDEFRHSRQYSAVVITPPCSQEWRSSEFSWWARRTATMTRWRRLRSCRSSCGTASWSRIPSVPCSAC